MRFLPYTAHPIRPLFIYLPGMDGSGELFQHQTKIWQNFDVRCLYLPPQYTNWQELTDSLIHLLKAELSKHHSKKVYICGESFGACLALKLVESVPHLIARCILINSASAFKKIPLLQLGPFVTNVMSEYIYQQATVLLLPFLGKLDAIDSQEKSLLLNVMQAVPPQIVSHRLSLLQNFSYQPFPNHPFIHLVASKEDQLLPSVAEAQKLNNQFSLSKISILPHSGHCCLLEKKVDLYRIIQSR